MSIVLLLTHISVGLYDYKYNKYSGIINLMKIFCNYIKRNYKIIITSILIILSIIFSVILISSIKRFQKLGELGADHRINGQPTYRHHKARISDIRTWMTFNYINTIFKIDPNYLKNTLSINDPQYPNLRIDRYIKRNNVNPMQFQIKLGEAITNYIPNK